MKVEPPLCGSAGGVPCYGYLRLRPLRGHCLRLRFRLAATRLPGAMRLPRRDTMLRKFVTGIKRPDTYGTSESPTPTLPHTHLYIP